MCFRNEKAQKLTPKEGIRRTTTEVSFNIEFENGNSYKIGVLTIFLAPGSKFYHTFSNCLSMKDLQIIPAKSTFLHNWAHFVVLLGNLYHVVDGYVLIESLLCLDNDSRDSYLRFVFDDWNVSWSHHI